MTEIEQTAQVLSTLTTCDGQPHATELHRKQARALADAGLLARPLPTREEIADVILAESLFGHRTPIAAADAVLDLLKGQDVLNPSNSMGIEHEENNDD